MILQLKEQLYSKILHYQESPDPKPSHERALDHKEVTGDSLSLMKKK